MVSGCGSSKAFDGSSTCTCSRRQVIIVLRLLYWLNENRNGLDGSTVVVVEVQFIVVLGEGCPCLLLARVKLLDLSGGDCDVVVVVVAVVAGCC